MQTQTTYAIGTAIIFQIIGIIAGIAIFILSDKKCLTKECEKLSTLMRDYLDPSKNPCDDFYLFTCGKMIEREDRYTGLLDKGRVTLVDDITDHLLRTTPGVKPHALYQARQLYVQCKDFHFSSDDDQKRMRDFINDCGGFPATDGAQWDKNAAKFTLEAAMRRLRQNGLSTEAFFSLNYKRDPRHSAKYILCISPRNPYKLFPQAMIATCINPKCVDFIFSISSAILVAAGVKAAMVEELAKELYEFDKKVAELIYKKIPPMPHEFTNLTMTVEQIQTKYNFLNWEEYFKFMFHPDGSGKGVPKNTLIVVEDPEYMDGIKLILTNSTKQQQANYLVWYNLMTFLYFPGMEKDPHHCFRVMTLAMPEILTALAVRIKNDVVFPASKRVIKNIGDKLINEIGRLSWMDDKTKKLASKKVNDIQMTIGYLEYFRNNDLIDAYYNLSPDSKTGPKLGVGKHFYESYRAVKKFRVYREAYCFSKALEEEFCKLLVYGELGLFDMRIFYDPLNNQLVVADSILREPTFSPQWPPYIYYSRFGFLVGHELTHIIDDLGRHYNEKGNVTDWWGKYTADNFKPKIECFREKHHGLYYFDGVYRRRLPENTSMNEIIGDNGGLYLSYYTYQKHKWWPAELKLPHIEYGFDQIFYISFAQIFCDEYSDGEYAEGFYSPHSPRPIRVVETLQNSPEFNKAFNCTKDSGMNPTKKCSFF